MKQKRTPESDEAFINNLGLDTKSVDVPKPDESVLIIDALNCVIGDEVNTNRIYNQLVPFHTSQTTMTLNELANALQNKFYSLASYNKGSEFNRADVRTLISDVRTLTLPLPEPVVDVPNPDESIEPIVEFTKDRKSVV